MQRLDTTKYSIILWYAFLGGAIGWKLQLMMNYSLVPYACARDAGFTIHLASAVSLAVALGAGVAAIVAWRRTGGYPFGWEGDDTEDGATMTRERFMAVGGLLMSAFFALVIAGQWIPTFILDPCWS